MRNLIALLALCLCCASLGDPLKMRWATQTELSNLEIAADLTNQTRESVVREIFEGVGRFTVYNANEHFKVRKLIMTVRRMECAPNGEKIRSEDEKEYAAEVSADVLTTTKFILNMPPVTSLGRDSIVRYELKSYRAMGEDVEAPYVVDANGDVVKTANVNQLQKRIETLEKEVRAKQKTAENPRKSDVKPMPKIKVIYCSNCGRKLNAYWKYCVECGTKVANAQTNQVPSVSANNSTK